MRINLNKLSTLNYRRIGYIAAIGSVAAVAARVSYSHILDVTLIAGQPADVAVVLPVAIDGMLLVATLAMAEDKANGRTPRGWARFGFWFGAGISLACNVASTIVHAEVAPALLPLAIFIAALAPALLLITVEIMARPGKLIAEVPVEEPVIDEEEQARQAAEAKKQQAAERRRITALVRSEMAKLDAAAIVPTSPAHVAAPMAPGIHIPTADEVAALAS